MYSLINYECYNSQKKFMLLRNYLKSDFRDRHIDEHYGLWSAGKISNGDCILSDREVCFLSHFRPSTSIEAIGTNAV